MEMNGSMNLDAQLGQVEQLLADIYPDAQLETGIHWIDPSIEKVFFGKIKDLITFFGSLFET